MERRRLLRLPPPLLRASPSVRIERSNKAAVAARMESMTQSLLAQIEAQLWPKGERRDIWMIADAARDRRIFRMLLESHFDYSCLYSGTLPPALEIAAPYLIQLEFEDRYTRRLIEHAWGNSWGVFLRSNTRMDKLRRHLRGFLVVRDPKGQSLVFRYYDPRVLRIYLPTCTREELRTVFGPIDCFWTEAESPDTLLEFGFDQASMSSKAIPLAPALTEANLQRKALSRQ
jgi:uncharacterized protein DUF4123